ncbi:hypothetical protein MMC25_002959 [Agyrium rufum]|nr:hypothetical protein [Agyrium rufum]
MHSKILLTTILLPLSLAAALQPRAASTKCPTPVTVTATKTKTITVTKTAIPKTSTTKSHSTSSSSVVAQATPTPFGVIAAHSGSAIHLDSLAAVNSTFFLGIESRSYCPLSKPSQCPPGTDTVLFVAPGGSAFLDVVVPGGQQIYVNSKTGALQFVEPHIDSPPTGSGVTGFSYVPGASYGDFGYSGLGANGFVACPTTASGGLYQVFAQIEGFVAPASTGPCIGFDALAPADTQAGAAAFEYL